MATFISLNHYDLVEVAGVDAEKYLQGQLTCDVMHLGSIASPSRFFRSILQSFFAVTAILLSLVVMEGLSAPFATHL